MFPRKDPSPSYLYAVRDVLGLVSIGTFTKLTGGETTISMVSYNLVFADGGSATRHMPSHTTYAPIKLSRPMDGSCMLIYKKFLDSSNGKLAQARTNFSITLIDHQGHERVIWNLYNAILTAMNGFNFTQDSGTQYADFEVTIQAERIELLFIGL